MQKGQLSGGDQALGAKVCYNFPPSSQKIADRHRTSLCTKKWTDYENHTQALFENFSGTVKECKLISYQKFSRSDFAIQSKATVYSQSKNRTRAQAAVSLFPSRHGKAAVKLYLPSPALHSFPTLAITSPVKRITFHISEISTRLPHRLQTRPGHEDECTCPDPGPKMDSVSAWCA
jgi:hypothetical protein